MVELSSQDRVEQYIKSHDGKYEIYHHMWREKGELQAVVFIVHGLGEHCHLYDRLIEFFTQKGIRVYSYDQRGHGRTHHVKGKGKQGWKGHIDANTEVVIGDIELLVGRAKGDGIGDEVPKYLLGYSLGGLMVTYYATMKELNGLSGLISISPAIGICRPPNVILRKLAPFAAKIIPTFTIEGDIRPFEISRLPEVWKAIEKDELVHRKVSFGTGSLILEMCGELEKEPEPEIKIPVLFIHGTADKITNPLVTEMFYNKLNCPMKRLYLHEEGYHKPHDDLGSEIVFEELEKFIKETGRQL